MVGCCRVREWAGGVRSSDGSRRWFATGTSVCDDRLMEALGLAVLDLFRDVPGDQVRRVADQARTESFAAGRVILEEGSLGDGFYVIADGAVDVVRGGAVLNRLKAGEFFGEMGAMDPGPGYGLARNASIVASVDTRVIVLPGKLFSELLATNAIVRDRVYAAMNRRGEA
jgi:CRP-like cAMP-binding protein